MSSTENVTKEDATDQEVARVVRALVGHLNSAVPPEREEQRESSDASSVKDEPLLFDNIYPYIKKYLMEGAKAEALKQRIAEALQSKPDTLGFLVDSMTSGRQADVPPVLAA